MRHSVLILFSFLIISILSCRQGDSDTNFEDLSPSQKAIISKYFTEHTAEYISVKDGFLFRLNDDVADDRTEVNGVKIRPHIEGEWQWLSDNTLSFSPDKPLDYGQKLVITMRMDELLQSDEHSSEPIAFQINTRKLRFEMNIDGLKIKDGPEGEELSLEGSITSTDFTPEELIQSLISVSQYRGNPTLSWEHTASGQKHIFSINNIIQTVDQNNALNINWNGTQWHNNFKGEKVIPIPAKEEFSVVDVRTTSNPSKSIDVYFSRPLLKSQNLNGLITINEETKNVKFSIDDNVLSIFPSSTFTGDLQLHISDKIKSHKNQSLQKESRHTVRFEYMAPMVRRVGNGMIIPNTDESYLPIEVVNLKAVDIEIFKIFENNVLQYLQENELNGTYSLDQVGRIVHREKVDVRQMENTLNHNKWIRIGIDLKKYIESDPASIYQIRVGTQAAYAITDCEEQLNAKALIRNGEESMTTYSNDYYENWESRNDPCHHSYYNPDRIVKTNVLMSDIGVIVKKGNQNQYHLSVNSISTGQSVNNATVTFHDYQQQRISEANTNGSGFISVKTEREASFIVVSHSTGYAYIKLYDQNSNSLSDFEVGGAAKSEGVEGFIYADRGVHRPGDTLFIHFMMEDTGQPIPQNHPVTLKIHDSKGNKKYEETITDHIERIYAFSVPTDVNDLTGQWRAIVKVGAHQFTKSLRIETVKPNRLKIELDLPEEMTYSDPNDRKFRIRARWLHGASAGGLKVKSTASIENISPSFDGVDDYVFSDPARFGSDALVNIYDGNLDDSGTVEAKIDITPEAFPGKIRTNVKTRVFENGGNFSENYNSLNISPFNTYIGVNTPKNRWGYSSVKIGENGSFKLVSVDEKGNKVGRRKLNVGVYNVNWRWWYYQGERYNIYRLNSANHKEAFYTTSVTTDNNGEYELNIDFQDIEYGRKMIRICDEESGHCTGDFFYATGWGRSDVEEERESLAKLHFTSTKAIYNKGERVKISIPSEKGSRILISLESGKDVIHKEWIEAKEGTTDYEFTTTREMTPNIYVHAIMVQSYDQKQNDLPLRMYGVIPIKVKDESNILHPAIQIADKLEPKEIFNITVSEKNNRAMAYTIAIVDEGLLDLTSFKTPDPHNHFFAKQALGVKTWDLYEYIMTDINGSVDRIITIGGDGDGSSSKEAKKAIRFKPVVMTAGPFYLHDGESMEHTFRMPNYIGSVRAMIVAKKARSFGHADKAIPVIKDLMILPTMPRVLSTGEIVSIPVTVFANEDHIKNATVSIETSDHLKIISKSSQTISFTKPGEQIIYFKAEVKDQTGIAKVSIDANSGSSSVNQEIEIDIRNPNPYESVVYDQVIEPGESYNTDLKLVGTLGTNEGILEVSTVPPVNLENRLEYLTSYPYGCLEQTVSSAFPQLSLDRVIDIDFNRKKKIEKNVNAAIRRISKLQRSNGGIAYWPSSSWINTWSTSYAGHFLLKAKENGYYVASDVLSSWSKYQTNIARKFRIDRSKKRWHQRYQMKDQAYRLYSLALHGNAELPSMNVLRQEIDLPSVAKYLLASAYALSGKESIATELIKNTSTEIEAYNELGYTYGSDVRDMAIISQTLMTLDKNQQAGQVIKRIANKLNSTNWYSTQTLSHALLSISEFVGQYENDNMKFDMTIGDEGNQSVDYKKPVFIYSFDPDHLKSTKTIISNTSENVLFVRYTMTGKKSIKDAIASDPYNRNINIVAKYQSLNGKEIDPSTLERGTDFIAHVQVKNQGSRGDNLDEMALSQIFPSGWEIQSGGLSNTDQAMKEDSYEYRDVRDDRVFTFFDLGDKKEYKIMLTAAYDGEYYLPPVLCEAMYDNEIQAKTRGMMVRVIPPKSGQ